jgi:simple sugar transport system permease protein
VTSTSAPPAPTGPEAPEHRPSAFFELFSRHGGGFVTSFLTAILAFLVGGLVVLATGHNPLTTYKGIFDGTGLNYLFPWVTGADRATAANYLQQTLLLTTTLVLTGLAVAFAFRCGLFNIGGQGQWAVGSMVSIWVGTSWADLAGPVHIVIAIVLATLAGAFWAGIAGILKATIGAHEVITTIMLNWIAYWVGTYAFGLGGPLQGSAKSVPISNDIARDARLPVVWGDPELQGLHIGLFVALAVLVTYWLILARSTLGFRVRAVGRNPEGARYGGISVGRSYFLAMAISGAFAGLGGSLDMLGWSFRLGVLDIQTSTIGFIGIAVALLGRNTAIGVLFSSLLFGALLFGTSTRSLDPSVFEPQLAGNLTRIIQGLVLLFVGADVLVLYLWKTRRLPRFRLPRRSRLPKLAAAGAAARRAAAPARIALPAAEVIARRVGAWVLARLPRGTKAVGIGACMLAVLAFWLALPPVMARTIAVPIVVGLLAAATGAWTVWKGRRRLGYSAIVLAALGAGLGVAATNSSTANLEEVFVWGALTASMLRFATPLVFASLGGMFSERSGVVNIGLEGMMLTGAFFGILAADKLGSWELGIVMAMVAGAVMAAIHAVVSIQFRADQIVSGTAVNFLAVGVTGYFFIQIYGAEGTPSGIAEIPNVSLSFLKDVPYFGDAFGDLSLMIWVSFAVLVLAYVVMFKTPFGLRLRSVGEHPRAADTVGLSVYGIRYRAVIISGVLAALGGAFLSIGFVHGFNEEMTAGRGFIALAALIFGMWRPKGLFAAALLFGFSSALAQRLPIYSESAATLFQALPYVLTLIAVAGVIGRSVPPASVGIPYEKK